MYSLPVRLVQVCLHVTEQVWQPMHLSRFITIATCAMTLIGNLRGTPGAAPDFVGWSREIDLLAATADDRHLVALAGGRAVVVEGVGELRVPAEQVGGLHHH